MLGIGNPGPFEWLIILVLLLAMVFGVGLAVRIYRATGRPREPRGFDVEPPRRDPQ